MKYLSLILSVCVLLLSTVPSFIEDKCLLLTSNIEQTDNCLGDTNQDKCTDCCSPFLHCATCSGFPPYGFSNSIEVIPTYQIEKNTSFYADGFFSEFCSKIWQPPQLS